MRNKHTTLRQAWDILCPGQKVRLVVFNEDVEDWGVDNIAKVGNQVGDFPRQWEAYADMRVLLLNYHTDKGYFYIVVEEE